MTLLAEAAPAGTENWLAILFYLVGGVTSVVVLVKQFTKPKSAPTVIADQPLHVKAATEYASKTEHDLLRDEVRDLRTDMQNGFKELSDERSRSVGNLHERIEDFDAKNQQLTADLRKEMKSDFNGVHNRITDVLSVVSKLQGSFETFARNSKHPFST